MVIFKEPKEDVNAFFSLFWLIILMTIWAVLGTLSEYSGEYRSIVYFLFWIVLITGFIFGLMSLIINTKPYISNLKKKTYIFDDQSFTIRHFIFKKSYEYSDLKGVGSNYEYIAFSYKDTLNTISTSDCKIAYNVVLELNKHLKAGDQAER